MLRRSLGPVVAGVLLAGVLLTGLPALGGALSPRRSELSPSRSAGAARAAHTRSASTARRTNRSFLTGIGDQRTQMFTDPLWKQLHTRIARFIVPYDAVRHGFNMAQSRQWIDAARAAHQQILIAFYHSDYRPLRIPTVGTYRKDVKAYMKAFPAVRQYQPWNEANRGNVRGRFASPTAVRAARFYKALKGACRSCRIVGLDLLDQPRVGPSLRYITKFKREVRRLRAGMPRIWGLHNYSDTNRFQGHRTAMILRRFGGNTWVTETGGVVKFGRSFPNRNGSGIRRAARALRFTFKLARRHARIKRLYIYQWTGSGPGARFDAGLMNARYRPRPGYRVVCRELRAARCNVRTVNN